MREILVRSRSGAATFVSDVSWAAIQITGHDSDWPTLNEERRVAVLQMRFPDRALPNSQHREEELFSAAHAEEILDFVAAHAERIEWLLVHCEAGASQSPAVAAALKRIFLQGDYHRFF